MRAETAARALRVMALAAAVTGTAARAQQASVVGTLHNLSASGPGEIRSLREPEVCKFCHIPHSAVVPKPLWGHAVSQVPQYEVAQIREGRGLRRPAPQPDGSSRLCLSCHDGTVALGELRRQRVPMAGAERLVSGRKSFLGTDLSGSHPVSFAVGDDVPADSSVDMGVKPLPASSVSGSFRLDRDGKMQCTTCHDPHKDVFYRPGEVPHFWVASTVTEVCLGCHELR